MKDKWARERIEAIDKGLRDSRIEHLRLALNVKKAIENVVTAIEKQGEAFSVIKEMIAKITR